MLQLPSDQLVTVPFCALGTPGSDFVLPPIVGSGSSSIQTQEYGIPLKQAQNPAFGGLPVKRIETNGVLQFYSNVLYFINQGGQFTFDVAQSTAIGGYSEGAVLFDFATSSYVISLMDNNTFDFVASPGYIDGIHWVKLTSLAYPDITDTGGLVTITGPSGLLVQNAVMCNTTLGVGTNANINGTLSAGGTITGNAGLNIVGTANFSLIASRGGVTINALSSNIAYLGSDNTSTGGFNGFQFDDTKGRPLLNTPSAALSSIFQVVCFADLAEVQLFSVIDSGGNAWQLLCQSFSGPFPSNNFSIIGNSAYTYGAGSTSATINLGVSGIAASAATLAIRGTTSEDSYATNLNGLAVNSTIGSTLLTVSTSGVPAGGTNNIEFQILYR